MICHHSTLLPTISILNDNLEQQLTTLYDYWFTQFDFPNENGKPYQSSGGKMVMNNCLKKKIPNGWNVESVYSNQLSSIIKPGVDKFDTKTYFATADIKGTSLSSGTLIRAKPAFGALGSRLLAHVVLSWYPSPRNRDGASGYKQYSIEPHLNHSCPVNWTAAIRKPSQAICNTLLRHCCSLAFLD